MSPTFLIFISRRDSAHLNFKIFERIGSCDITAILTSKDWYKRAGYKMTQLLKRDFPVHKKHSIASISLETFVKEPGDFRCYFSQ